MLSKSNIQYIRSLQQKKFRLKHGQFVVEGPKLVSELLKSRFRVQSVFAIDQWIQGSNSAADEIKNVVQISRNELMRISGLKSPDQVLAIVSVPEEINRAPEITEGHSLFLDGISDPGNLGTIIRTADWFGMDQIVCSPDTVELFNPKVVQSTMGSLFRMKIHYAGLVPLLHKLEGQFPVYGTFMHGSNIYDEPFGSKGIIVLGSESHGIDPEIERIVKIKLHIPSHNSQAESLNVSVAAAICCSEIKRPVLMNI